MKQQENKHLLRQAYEGGHNRNREVCQSYVNIVILNQLKDRMERQLNATSLKLHKQQKFSTYN
jgi:hypothetical protein